MEKEYRGNTGRVRTASKHTGPIFDLDFRKEKGLETMLQKGDFLKDENQDLLPDVLDVKIVLPEDADDAMLVAACNLAWRFGMETTGYKELLRQMQLIQATGSFWKKQSRQSLYGKKKEKV